MIIYSNGCSHTAATEGYETYYIDIITRTLSNTHEYEWWNPTEGHFDIFKNTDFSSLDDNETYVLKHAEHGKSNDLIFFETYNMVLDSVKSGKKIDYAIIQFSGVNRRVHTIPCEERGMRLIHVNPHENYKWGIKLEPFATEQSLQYLVILQELFKKHKIEYVFIPYMEFDLDALNLSDKLDLLDESRFTADLRIGHRNPFRSMGYCRDEQGHPNYRGYYELAKKCLEILNIDSILPIEKYYSLEKRNYDDDLVKKYGFIKKYSAELGDGTNSELELVRKKSNII